MSTIVIVAIGSRGDVAPLTGVGVRLQQAGHHVVMAAYTPFADLITGCGLRFRELPVDFDPAIGIADANPLKGLAEFLAPSGMRAMGQGVLAALRDEPADVLLLSPFSELVGHPLAEAKDIPSVGVRLQPLSATAACPPAVLGGWSAGAIGNRLASDTGAWLLDSLYGRVIAGSVVISACPKPPRDHYADAVQTRNGLSCTGIHPALRLGRASGGPA